jgi:hypothetical protein
VRFARIGDAQLNTGPYINYHTPRIIVSSNCKLTIDLTTQVRLNPKV